MSAESSVGVGVFGVLDDENEDHLQNEGSSGGGGGGGGRSGIDGGDDAMLASSGAAEGQDDSGWQTTTKARRLAPSHTLSHKDLGADSPRSKATSQELAASKKKVIRFTREDIMSRRKPSKVLASMMELQDVLSVPPLDPVSFTPLDHDEVFRLWHLDKGNKDKDGKARNTKGRGRDDDDGDGEGGNDWQRGGRSKGGDLWDDVGDEGGSSSRRNGGAGGGGGGGGTGGNLDLADFAAAALKFSTDTRGLGLADMGLDDGGPRRANEEDALERLVREQNAAEGDGAEDDEGEPDWADADVNQPIDMSAPTSRVAASSGAGGGSSETKRNLLFETLNIRRSDAVAAPAPAASAAASSAALQVPQEWFYRDPQGNLQGPFDTESMRQWHEAGYFTPDLPVKLRHWVGFHILRSLFRDADEAFAPNIALVEPMSAAQLAAQGAHPSLVNAQNMEALLRQQQMEQQQRQQQQQRIEEQRRQALVEQQRQQEAAAAMVAKQKQEEAARLAEMKRLQAEAEQMEMARKAAMAMQGQGQGMPGYGVQGRGGDDGKAALVYQIAYNKPGPVGLAVAAHGLSYQVAPGQLQGVHVPMVRDVAPGTPIVPGDILLSVNGKPLVAAVEKSQGGQRFVDIVTAMVNNEPAPRILRFFRCPKVNVHQVLTSQYVVPTVLSDFDACVLLQC